MTKKELLEALEDFEDDIKICVDEIDCVYEGGEDKIILKSKELLGNVDRKIRLFDGKCINCGGNTMRFIHDKCLSCGKDIRV